MIRIYLLALLAAAIGVTCALALRGEGYVLVAWRQWTLETSISGLLLALIALLILLGALLRVLRIGFSLPSLLRERARERREAKARDSFEQGLLHLTEGRWREAEIELVRRAADHRASALNYYAAARAAQRLGAPERRAHYLTLAARSAPEQELALALTTAQLERERGEHAAARATLGALALRHPQHPTVTALLAETLHACQDATALCELLLEKSAAAALGAARHSVLLREALGREFARHRGAADLDGLKRLWARTPENERRHPPLRLAYAQGLAQLNAQAEASALCTAALTREWDAGLAQLYGTLETTEALTQLAALEAWLAQHGETPALLLAAGRACLRNKLWGKARSYLDAALKAAPSAQVYLELARLCEQSGNAAEAQRFARQGLEWSAQQS